MGEGLDDPPSAEGAACVRGRSVRAVDVISWGFGAQEQDDLTICTFQPLQKITIELDVMRTPAAA